MTLHTGDIDWGTKSADSVAEVGTEQPMDASTPTAHSPAVVQKSHSSLATELVELVTNSNAELWHDPTSQQPYITVTIDHHREHYRLDTRAAHDWLARLAHQTLGRVPSGQAVTDAARALSATERYDGAAHSVGVRLAAFGDSLVLDLGDPSWRVVVITPSGWHIEELSPIRFRRPRGMLALPEPVPGGSLNPLRELLQITSEATWTQLVGWQLGMFAPSGPYPVEMLLGEQGSGKSLLGRFQRGLIDPHMTPLRGPVRDERDLMIAASHAHVVALDNISRIPNWLADSLCRIATGGGFATRALRTDDDEHIIAVTKPVMLTAISAVITRGDLLDRATVISLPTIPESRRRSESTLLAEYEALRPSLLGAELDLVVAALRERAGVKASALPRMADHVLWVMAAEKALGWVPGTYARAYSQQQQDAVEIQLDGDALVHALRHLMADREIWKGTPTEHYRASQTHGRNPRHRDRIEQGNASACPDPALANTDTGEQSVGC
jgi:hypothetical protein